MGLSLEQSELFVGRRYGEVDWGREITIRDELRDGKNRGSFFLMEINEYMEVIFCLLKDLTMNRFLKMLLKEKVLAYSVEQVFR